MSTISIYMIYVSLGKKVWQIQMFDTRKYLQKCVHYKIIKIVKFLWLFNSMVCA